MDPETPPPTPKKSFALLYVFLFLVGAGGVLGARYVQISQLTHPTQEVAIQSPLVTPTPIPPYTLVPPADAVPVIMGTFDGLVSKLSRETGAGVEATTGAALFTDEILYTGDDATAEASISGYAHIAMEANSEVHFAGLLPHQILLIQPTGIVTYTVITPEKPIHIRSLSELITLYAGSVTVDTEDGFVVLTQKTGRSVFAFLDNAGETHAYLLKEKMRATINDAASTIRFR